MSIFKMINFKPWVGKKYNSQSCHFGVKLMILGESHYSKDELCKEKDPTNQVIKNLGINKRKNSGRTFTKIAKLILNRGKESITEEERREVWNHLIFYNFVQEYVGRAARERPTAQMWANGVEPLQRILSEYKPELILVLGKALRRHVQPILENTNVVVCYVQHPATSFSYEEWCPDFQSKLNEAKLKQRAKIEALGKEV